MTSQIPPEPPGSVLVVIKRKHSDPNRKPTVVEAWQRSDYHALGPDNWHQIGRVDGQATDWKTLWTENNRDDLYVYVANEFVDLWRYNGMEYPK